MIHQWLFGISTCRNDAIHFKCIIAEGIIRFWVSQAITFGFQCSDTTYQFSIAPTVVHSTGSHSFFWPEYGLIAIRSREIVILTSIFMSKIICFYRTKRFTVVLFVDIVQIGECLAVYEFAPILAYAVYARPKMQISAAQYPR